MDKCKDIPTGQKPPEIVTVVVEATKDSRNSYDVRGAFTRLKSVTYATVTYPADYGFIPRTIWQDQNPLRAMVITEYPTFPGCMIDAVPIGILKVMETDIRTDKILCVPLADPEYDSVRDIKKIQEHYRKELEDFFLMQNTPKNKKLGDNNTKIIGWSGAKEAKNAILQAMKLYEIKK